MNGLHLEHLESIMAGPPSRALVPYEPFEPEEVVDAELLPPPPKKSSIRQETDLNGDRRYYIYFTQRDLVSRPQGDVDDLVAALTTVAEIMVSWREEPNPSVFVGADPGYPDFEKVFIKLRDDLIWDHYK